MGQLFGLFQQQRLSGRQLVTDPTVRVQLPELCDLWLAEPTGEPGFAQPVDAIDRSCRATKTGCFARRAVQGDPKVGAHRAVPIAVEQAAVIGDRDQRSLLGVESATLELVGVNAFVQLAAGELHPGIREM